MKKYFRSPISIFLLGVFLCAASFLLGGGLCASFFLRKEKKQEFYSGEVTPTNEDNRLSEQWERMAELNLLCCVYIDSYGEEPPPCAAGTKFDSQQVDFFFKIYQAYIVAQAYGASDESALVKIREHGVLPARCVQSYAAVSQKVRKFFHVWLPLYNQVIAEEYGASPESIDEFDRRLAGYIKFSRDALWGGDMSKYPKFTPRELIERANDAILSGERTNQE